MGLLAVCADFGIGAGDGSASASAAPSAAAIAAPSGEPVPDIVQKAPVQHVKVGDLDVGYRTVGPLGAAAGSTPLLMIMGFSRTVMDVMGWSMGGDVALDLAVRRP